MLRFFRKIRSSLLNRDSYPKYLIYAIGEIVLVMLGILLALQVNNWNETRQEILYEKSTLLALKEDFQENQKELEKTLGQQNRVISFNTKLLEWFIENDPQNLADSVGAYLFRGAYSFFRPELILGSYNALIGVGRTDLIKNKDLRKRLAEFSSDVESGFEDHDHSMLLTANMEQMTSPYAAYLVPNDYFKLELNFNQEKERHQKALLGLMEEKAFISLLIQKTAIEKLRLYRQEKLLRRCNKILADITTELEKHP